MFLWILAFIFGSPLSAESLPTQKSTDKSATYTYNCQSLGKAPTWLSIKNFKLKLGNEEAALIFTEGPKNHEQEVQGSLNPNYLPEKHSGYHQYAGFQDNATLEVEQDLLSGGYLLAKEGHGGIVKVRQSSTLFQPYLCRNSSPKVLSKEASTSAQLL